MALASSAESPSIGGLPMLPNETIVKHISAEQDALWLTSSRLIQVGVAKRLFFLRGGSRVAVAGLQDIDAVSFGKKFLPMWVAIVGVLIVLAGLSQTSGPSTRGGGLLILLIGAACIALWYFFNSNVLEFKVSGQAHFVFNVTGLIDPTAELTPFVAEYYRAKALAYEADQNN